MPKDIIAGNTFNVLAGLHHRAETSHKSLREAVESLNQALEECWSRDRMSLEECVSLLHRRWLDVRRCYLSTGPESVVSRWQDAVRMDLVWDDTPEFAVRHPVCVSPWGVPADSIIPARDSPSKLRASLSDILHHESSQAISALPSITAMTGQGQDHEYCEEWFARMLVPAGTENTKRAVLGPEAPASQMARAAAALMQDLSGYSSDGPSETVRILADFLGPWDPSHLGAYSEWAKRCARHASDASAALMSWMASSSGLEHRNRLAEAYAAASALSSEVGSLCTDVPGSVMSAVKPLGSQSYMQPVGDSSFLCARARPCMPGVVEIRDDGRPAVDFRPGAEWESGPVEAVLARASEAASTLANWARSADAGPPDVHPPTVLSVAELLRRAAAAARKYPTVSWSRVLGYS